MQPQAINYHTYMLRIWDEPESGRSDEKTKWRFSLNDTISGEQWGFTSLESLSQFLEGLVPNENLCAINARSTFAA